MKKNARRIKYGKQETFGFFDDDNEQVIPERSRVRSSPMASFSLGSAPLLHWRIGCMITDRIRLRNELYFKPT